MIKRCFTTPGSLSGSPFPTCYNIGLFLTTWRDIPKNKSQLEFTSQFPLWNCEISYQIIDRIPPYILRGQALCTLYAFVRDDLCFCFSLLCLWARVYRATSQEQGVILHFSSVFIRRRLLSLSLSLCLLVSSQFIPKRISHSDKSCRVETLNIYLDEPPWLPSRKRPDKHNIWHAWLFFF